MKIIVCIKQTPDTSEMKFDAESKTIIRDGVENIVNPFDLYAVEEALRIKQERPDTLITAITMGPPSAENVLREVMSMGVDDAILITDKAFAASDTLATSYTLATAIKKMGDFDLLMFGKQAIDGDTAQVGPGVAEFLNIPQITFIRKIVEITDTNITAQRAIEDGYEVIETTLPCALTCIKELNEPRLPSLRGKMKARKAEIPSWNAEFIGADTESIGFKGSPTFVKKAFTPSIDKQNMVFSDEDPEKNIDMLIEALKSKKII